MVPLLKFLFTETKVTKMYIRIELNVIICKQKPYFYSLLVMQCSAGRSLFFIRPCRTDLTDGRWTSCNTNRWDCGERGGGNHYFKMGFDEDIHVFDLNTDYLHSSRLSQ